MHLAIEYALRTESLKSSIKFPLSIMLEHKKLDDKIVIVISDKNELYCVKQWYVSRYTGQYLPSFKEFYVAKNELYNNDNIILSNYYLLRFTPNPYCNNRKQQSEFPFGLSQEKEYTNYIQTFYNPEANKIKRLNWLWDAFKMANKNEFKKYDNLYSYPYFGYSHVNEFLTNQRMKIEQNSKKLWLNWLLWRKYMLDFESYVATEILFQKEYFLMNEKEDKEPLIILPEYY